MKRLPQKELKWRPGLRPETPEEIAADKRIEMRNRTTFYISETWFGSAGNAKKGGWANAEAMDRELVRRWNVAVGEQDTVYHLGGVSSHGDHALEALLKCLNGKKRLIPACLEDQRRIAVFKKLNWEIITDIPHRPPEQDFVITYYPMLRWPGDQDGEDQLFGMDYGGSIVDGSFCCAARLRHMQYTPQRLDQAMDGHLGFHDGRTHTLLRCKRAPRQECNAYRPLMLAGYAEGDMAYQKLKEKMPDRQR